MTKTRKAGRKRKHRSVVPKPIAKGVKQITAITSKVARGIDKYPLAALRKVGKEVLKPRKFPGLRGGGTGCCAKLNPGAFGSSSTKKGGRKRRGGSKKRSGGRKTRSGGRKKRRGGSKKRSGGRKTRR